MSVVCIECSGKAELVTGKVIYPHRRDLHLKKFYLCVCGAHVGCHDGTENALGAPCKAVTRQARMAAHAAFDPLWKAKIKRDGCSKNKARGAGYKWLAGQMGIEPRKCHIGMMDKIQARLVVKICEGVKK
tara:strand:- start:4675 stop:5064 length:390 start_codon:yes stop_codon:yes gene_type:complete